MSCAKHACNDFGDTDQNCPYCLLKEAMAEVERLRKWLGLIAGQRCRPHTAIESALCPACMAETALKG